MNRYKYPRTPHLPLSETITNDDKKLKDTNHFNGKKIVITEKMDGENSTIYRGYYHARSLDSSHKDYHSWLLSYIRSFQYRLDCDTRICGEYLYAKHSIKYNDLENYFQVFSVWNKDICLSWEDTKKICNELGLTLVPELYIGEFDDTLIYEIAKKTILNGGEGIVIRNIEAFDYSLFDLNVAKYVRKNHIQTDEHWSNGKIEINTIKK